MNTRKNRIAFFILILTLSGTLSCTKQGSARKESESSKKITILTSFVVLADIAENVAGDAARVVSVTKPGTEIHTYQPTPQDIVRAQDADLILYNGLNLELWFERFLQDVKETTPVVVVSDTITPMSIYKGPYTGKPNPHAWMSPKNGVIYAENIRKALVEIDPGNADTYNANAKAYSEKILELYDYLDDELRSIPESQRYLVTSEGAFSYLARDLDFKEVFLWPINADQHGTPQQVRDVINTVNQYKIPVVFSESTISPKAAQQVASETDAVYGGVLYVDSLSVEDGPVPTYLDMLKVTTRTIAEGFKKGLSQ